MERRRLHLFRKVYPLFQSFPGFILLLDLDRRVLFVNAYFRDQFGEPEGRPFDEICHIFGDAEHEWPLNTGIGPRKWEGLMPDGRPYSVCSLPFMEENGFPHVLVLGMRITEWRHTDQALRKISEILEKRIEERVADISLANEVLQEEVEELRHAEVELRRTCEDLEACNEALRRSQGSLEADRRRLEAEGNRFRSLLDALPHAVIAFDAEGRATLWNPAAERTFGWKEEEVLGRFNPIVPEEEEEAFRAFLERVLAGDVMPDLKIRGRRKDGAAVDVLLSAAPVRDPEGRTSGCAAVLVRRGTARRSDIPEECR
jgi:PAS domain S-box-containing protein